MERRELLLGMAFVTASLSGCAGSERGQAENQIKTDTPNCHTETSTETNVLYESERVRGVFKVSPWTTKVTPGDTISVKVSPVEERKSKINLVFKMNGDAIYKGQRKQYINKEYEVQEKGQFVVDLNEPQFMRADERTFYQVKIVHETLTRNQVCD